MPKCNGCGNRFSVLGLSHGVCDQCIEAETPRCLGCNNPFDPQLMSEGYCGPCYDTLRFEKHKVLAERQLQDQVAAIILTTESACGLEIQERIEIITAECVYGMQQFKELFKLAADRSGGRNKTAQCMLKEARKTVLHELKKEAHAVGANAVVAVDLDYREFSDTGNNGSDLLFVVAKGTAVRANIG